MKILCIENTLRPFQNLQSGLTSLFFDGTINKIWFGNTKTDIDRVNYCSGVFSTEVTGGQDPHLNHLMGQKIVGKISIKWTDSHFDVTIEVHLGDFFQELEYAGGHDHTYAADIYSKFSNFFRRDINESIHYSLNGVYLHDFSIRWKIDPFKG
jgi:hypothetical protein